MTPENLAVAALDAMINPGPYGPELIVRLPKGSIPRDFPKGELLNAVKRDGVLQMTYRFDAQKVLRYLQAHGLEIKCCDET